MSSATSPDWPSLAIVVPVYNEGANIEHSLREIAEVAQQYPGRAIVIAVDDGSSDNSANVLSDLAGELNLLKLSRHDSNAGYGAALRTGAQDAAKMGLDYVAFIDSDLTNPPADLLKIGALARDGEPYIKGSRFLPGGGMGSVPFRRRAVTRAGNAVGRLLFGTRLADVTNGFRAVRTELFLSWPLQERGFPIIVEELDWALRQGIEPAEFPTVLTARGSGQRTSTFPYSLQTLRSYLRYPMRSLRRRLGNAMKRSR